MESTTLDDVVQTLDTTSAVEAEGGEESVLSRLESVISGEKPPEETEVAETEETDEPTSEEEETPTDTDEEAEADETDEETEEQDEETEEDDAETLELEESQLAELLGLSEDGVQITDDGDMKIKTKVDGKEEYVPMKDLVSSYQLEKHLRNKSQVDAEARREFEALKQEETARIQQTFTDATALVHQLEQDFLGSVQATNMDELRQTNPAEWAAKNQEFQTQAARIQQAKEMIRQNISVQQQQSQQQAEAQKAKYIEEQTEKLLEAVPAWQDEKVAAKEIGEMQSAVSEMYGFTPEEISQINDHRVILMLRDAVKGKVTTDANPVKKRLKKVPKIVKPGSNKVQKKNAAKKRVTDIKRKRAREVGTTSAVADLVLDII